MTSELYRRKMDGVCIDVCYMFVCLFDYHLNCSLRWELWRPRRRRLPCMCPVLVGLDQWKLGLPGFWSAGCSFYVLTVQRDAGFEEWLEGETTCLIAGCSSHSKPSDWWFGTYVILTVIVGMIIQFDYCIFEGMG